MKICPLAQLVRQARGGLTETAAEGREEGRVLCEAAAGRDFAEVQAGCLEKTSGECETLREDFRRDAVSVYLSEREFEYAQREVHLPCDRRRGGRAIGRRRIRILGKTVASKKLKLDVSATGPKPRDIRMRRYLVDVELLKLVREATTDSGETDTAKWMTGAR